jgi:opacity protein-like surface antigen
MSILKLSLLTTFIIGFAFSAAARDPNAGFYVSGAGGPHYVRNKPAEDAYRVETGKGGEIALGYDTGKAYRFELELGFVRQKQRPPIWLYNQPSLVIWPGPSYPKGDRISAMANAFRDFSLNDRWDYYLGAGLGLMSFHSIDYDIQGKLAAQFLTGFAYHATRVLTLTAGYRLSGAETVRLPFGRLNTGAFHAVEVGLRVKL